MDDLLNYLKDKIKVMIQKKFTQLDMYSFCSRMSRWFLVLTCHQCSRLWKKRKYSNSITILKYFYLNCQWVNVSIHKVLNSSVLCFCTSNYCYRQGITTALENYHMDTMQLLQQKFPEVIIFDSFMPAAERSTHVLCINHSCSIKMQTFH